MPQSRFKDWISKPGNREQLNKRRRERFKKDPAYRKRVLKSSKRWRVKDAQRKKKKPTKIKFTIGEAATKLSCDQKTIRNLERLDLIPSSADGRTHRRYTKQQIALMSTLIAYRKRVHYRDPKYQPHLEKLSSEAHAQWG